MSNESDMREFRSLPLQTFKENSPKNLSVFSQYLERYFLKQRMKISGILKTRTKIPYQRDNSTCSMRNIAVQCADQYRAINVSFS